MLAPERSNKEQVPILNQSLVNPELESVPCLATLTTRRLARSNLESLCLELVSDELTVGRRGRCIQEDGLVPS